MASFGRMVIGLPKGAGHRSSIRAAADLAGFLNIELLGAFIADADLRSLMGLPGRELRIADLQWQPIDLTSIPGHLEHLIDAARNHFAECVASRAVKTSFKVIEGTHGFGSLIRNTDIVAVIEPAHPGERITQQFTALLDAAFANSAAILVVPRRIMHSSGPITAVATSGDDASILAALEIADALKERLVIATQPGISASAAILANASRRGVEVEQIAAAAALADVQAWTRLLSRSKGRLHVISRSRRSDLYKPFLAVDGIPVLFVEADRGDPTETLEKQEADRNEQA